MPKIISQSDRSSRSPALALALTVSIASFMQMLDASIIATALPQAAKTFGVGPVDVGLGIIVYVLAASIVIPASPWIADRFGARRVFVGALLGFTVASVLCGASTGLASFVAARTLQGVAGALMASLGQMILVRSVNRADLLRIMNISAVPMLVAPVLGPPLGGILAETIGWPWIFYLNVPVGLLGIALVFRHLPHLPQVRRPFDLLGFILNATALALILFGIERLTGPSASVPAAAAVIAAGTASGALALRHLRRGAHPLLSLEPLRSATFRIAVVSALPLIRLPIGALLFALPIMLQVAMGKSALVAGLILFAHAAGDLMMKPFMTRTFRIVGYRTVLVASTAATSVGIGICGLLARETPLAVIFPLLFVIGCSRSFVMTGLSTLGFDEMPERLAGSAVTLSQIVLQLAAGLSVALATILFDVSTALNGRPAGAITAADGRLVLMTIAALGLLALPALLRLPRTAGDKLAGRSNATVLEG